VTEHTLPALWKLTGMLKCTGNQLIIPRCK